MRLPRIKVDADQEEAAYHCVTRTVNKERLFNDVAKEILRRQLWQVAEYCGVQVLTYVLMSNHFHVLVRVPRREVPSDEELLRRYAILYPHPTRYHAERMEVIRAQLAVNGPLAILWRRRQLALMGDVSQFMKLLKQRFSIWFNRSHQRIGTLWCERFKSVLVEPRGRALETMAAYIDANPIRAGIKRDPKDYRFNGYAEALAGSESARRGLCTILGVADWDAAQAEYRRMIYASAAASRLHKHSVSADELRRVMREGGRLPLAVVVRCRLRYFTDGAVLGSRAFVAEQLTRYRQRTGQTRTTEPRLLPALTDWGDLAILRRLRGEAIG